MSPKLVPRSNQARLYHEALRKQPLKSKAKHADSKGSFKKKQRNKQRPAALPARWPIQLRSFSCVWSTHRGATAMQFFAGKSTVPGEGERLKRRIGHIKKTKATFVYVHQPQQLGTTFLLVGWQREPGRMGRPVAAPSGWVAWWRRLLTRSRRWSGGTAA